MKRLKKIKKITEHKIIFKFKSFHHQIIEKTLTKVIFKLNSVNIIKYTVFPLPIRLQRFTVLRSPHIDKKSREQFELNQYSKSLILNYNVNNINDKIKIKYIIDYIKNSSSGCELTIIYQT